MPVPEHLASAPCPHGVELDMCDTYQCAREYNRLDAKHDDDVVSVILSPGSVPEAVVDHYGEELALLINGHTLDGSDIDW